MKHLLQLVLVAVLAWVGVEAALTLRATRATEAALPIVITAQLQPLRVTIIEKLAILDALQPVLAAARAKIDAIKIPDAQPVLDATKAKIDAIAVQPTLDEATASLKDAHDSFDSMYWDLNALVQNMTVATHGIAVTSDVIAQAAPQMVATAQAGEAQLTGIAKDVHTVTTQIATPKTFMGKVWAGVKGLAGLARFI